MAHILDFGTEFVQRTRILLTDYKGEYKLSNALNCMLGLIILPNEKLSRSRSSIWSSLVADIDELDYLRIKMFEPIQKKKAGVIVYSPKTLRYFLKKVRNGLAHQNISPVNEEGIFTGVVIRNFYIEDGPVLDLEVEFDRDELERFALFIAAKYLGE